MFPRQLRLNFGIAIGLVVAASALGCGKFSNTVEIQFDPPKTETHPTSAPFLGLSAAGNTKTQGAFKLEGGVGNSLPAALRTSGSFKFYGGIQGEVFSR